VLYWKFDEGGGSTAIDSSGNGLNGTLISVSPYPLPKYSAMVPPAAKFADPFSLLLLGGATSPNSLVRQAVHLANPPNVLKPANNLTVSAWYRATDTDSSGGEVISLGDYYVLRLRSNGSVEFSHLRAVGGGFVQCITPTGTPAAALDGKWHHLAGVASAGTGGDGGTNTSPEAGTGSNSGTTVYWDGTPMCCGNLTGCPAWNPDVSNIGYTGRGTDFFVGRHGFNSPNWDFDGNIDEVRVYTRVLSPSEIASLAQGAD
jgi:hypothetical protein